MSAFSSIIRRTERAGFPVAPSAEIRRMAEDINIKRRAVYAQKAQEQHHGHVQRTQHLPRVAALSRIPSAHHQRRQVRDARSVEECAALQIRTVETDHARVLDAAEIAVGETVIRPGDQVVAILKPGLEDQVRRTLAGT
mgnify:CR=1 FL=1